MHRLDDGEGEEEGDEQELDGHLEEGEVYVGVEARRSQHLLVRNFPERYDPAEEAVGELRERRRKIVLFLARSIEAFPSRAEELYDWSAFRCVSYNKATCAKSQEGAHAEYERDGDLQPDIARSRCAVDVIPASLARLVSAFYHCREIGALAM
jgi:hypothetical protein